MKLLKLMSKKLGDLQAKIILSAVYCLILPFFVVFRPKHKETGWEKWGIKSDSLDDLKKQY